MIVAVGTATAVGVGIVTGVGVIITVTAVTTAGEAVAGNHPQTKKRRIERRFFCACDLPSVQYCVRSANGCRPSQTL
jgi:hypothetical protein